MIVPVLLKIAPMVKATNLIGNVCGSFFLHLLDGAP
jgi:hypothetical protein